MSIGSGLFRPLGSRPLTAAVTEGVGSSFSPASLFGASDKGLWYDPSDTSTLFQDSAGTTAAATAGDPIGKLLDKSGKGNHATQPTAGNRPTRGSIGSLAAVNHAALGALITPAIFDATFNNAMTVFMVIKRGAPHTDNRLVIGRTSPSFWIGSNGSNEVTDLTTGMSGDGLKTLAIDGVVALTVGTAQFSMGLDRFWYTYGRNADAHLRTSTALTGNLGFTGNTLFLGGQSSTTFLWPGHIGEIIILNREVTAVEYARTVRYLTAKWNMYAKPLFVCAGNSLTSGQGSTGGTSQALSASGTNYPSRLLAAIGSTYDVRTSSFGGRKLDNMIAEDTDFADMMTAGPGQRRVVLAWEITNQLNTGSSKETTLALLQQYCLARKAAGFNVLVGTCLNRGDGGANFNADRQWINTQILAGYTAYADGVVDFAAVSQLSDYTNTTYFNADTIHLTDAGYQIVSDTVTAKLTALGW